MNSYEKQLIFITCNNVKVFNNMFMRAGRIDRIYEFKPLNKETAKQMFLNFIDNIPNSTLGMKWLVTLMIMVKWFQLNCRLYY